MNRPWSDWMFRLFKNANAKKQGRKNRPQFAVEHLEDRSVPAAGIMVIEGASGSGDLDDELLSGGDVTAAEVTAATLGTLSTGALEALAANVDVSVTSPGSITFDDLIGNGGQGPVSLQTGAANIATFTANNGDIAFEQQSDGLTTAGGRIILTASNGLTLGALTSNGGRIDLTANVMDLGAAINAGTGRVSIQQFTAGRLISLGGADAMATTLGITNTELGQITASLIKIGNSASGTIDISSPISQTAGFNTLSLQSSDQITETGGPIVVDRLLLRAVNGISLPNTANDFESIAAVTTAASADIVLRDTDSILVDSITDQVGTLSGITTSNAAGSVIQLNVNSLASQAAGANLFTNELELLGTATYNFANTGNDAVTLAAALTGAGRSLTYVDANALTIGAAGTPTNGITTTDGTVNVSTVAGVLTLLNTVGDVSSGAASTSLTAGGTGNLLDIQTGVTVTATGVTLTADQLNIADANAVNAGGGRVVIQNATAGRLIDLGTDNAAQLGISATEINTNITNASVIVVGRNDALASGTINVTGAIFTAGTLQLELVTGGAITDGGGNIIETRLGLTAGAVIGAAGNPLDITALNLEAFTPTGGIFISSTGVPLTIGGVNATLTGVRTGQNSITLTNDNSIIIGATAAEGISIGGVTGNIIVQVTGAASDVSVNAAVTNMAPGGTISIIADDDVSVTAPVSTTNGNGAISLRSDNDNSGAGSISTTSTGTVTAATGSINISSSGTVDGGNVLVGGAVSTTGGAIAITSASNVTINASVATTTNTISVVADSNINGAGDYTSAATGSLMTTTGSITVFGNNITAGGMIASSGGGNISISTLNSNADGDIAINAPVIASGGNGLVNISSDDDVSITAVVSAAGTGNISVTADVNGDSDGSLSTSGAITAVNGSITLTAEDDVMIGAAVSTTGTTGGVIQITADPTADDGNFSSNTPGTISTTVGPVSIAAADNITIGGAISVGGTGTLLITADTPGGTLGDVLIGAAVSTAGGNITIVAQDTDIPGTITTPAANRVILRNRDVADVITLGTDTVNALGLTNADLNNITTGTLKIGGTGQSGDISFTAPITLTVAKVPVLSLETTGAILDNVAGETSFLTVRDLALRAGTGVGSADDLDLSVANLAASNTTAGNINISNTGVATLTLARNIDGLSGITQTAGGFDVNISNAGTIVVDSVVNSTGGGDNDVTLTTTGPSGGISNTVNGIVQTNNGTGDLLLDASSSGSITIVDSSVGTEVSADNTGGITLLANDAVSIGANVTISTDTGDIALTANATDPTGTSNVTLGANSVISTAGNVVIIADEGNGVGGAIVMAPGSSITGALNVTLTAAQDITVTAISATQDITVTVTGNLGNIVDDGIDSTALVAGDDIMLTSGGRIGGQTTLTTADVESAATGTPTTNFLALVDVNYGDDLVLAQVGGLGNIQIRRVGGGINTSAVFGEEGTLVGPGNQLALVSAGGTFTVDDNFNFNGANNSDLFFATTGGNNFVITAGNSLVNGGGTAVTSVMVSGSGTASIQGPAVADNTADITAANLRLFTTGGTIGTSALLPLEVNAVTLGGFTNGRPNGVTPAAGGAVFLTDTLNGVAVTQINAGTGNVTLNSRGQIQAGPGTGSSIIAASATQNDLVPEIIGGVVTLDTSVATANGAGGHIGFFAGSGQFFELDATVINATTNASTVWLAEVAAPGAALGLVNVGTAAGTAAFLRAANGATLTNDADMLADVIAPTVNLSTGTGGGNFGTSPAAPIQIDAGVLVGNLANGGNAFVQDLLGLNALGLTVQRLTTTAGDLGVTTTGASSDLTLGNASTTSAAVETAAGTATLNSAGAIVSNATAGPLDVIAATLSATAATGVGTLANPLLTDVNNLSAAGGTGGVFDTNTGPLAIVGTGVTATGPIAVSTSGTLGVNAVVTGGSTVSLTTTGAGGDITTTAAVTAATDAVVTASGALTTGAAVTGTAGLATLSATGALTANGTVTAGTAASLMGTSVTTTAAVTGGTTASLTATAGALSTGGAVTANGGAATLLAAGPVTVGGNVSGTLGTTITATDAAGAGQDVTIAMGAAVSAGAGMNVTVNAGDNLTVNGTITTTGAGVTTLNLDTGAADAGLGSTASISSPTALSSATPVQIIGGADADTINLAPQTGAVVNVVGNAPATFPGDTLALNLTGTTILTAPAQGATSGTFTFTGGRQNITFTGIENAATATVTVAATDAAAAEVGVGGTANPGQFTFTRTGDTTQPLTVTYTISGTATNGTDYQTLSGTVNFAAGSATATVVVNVLEDLLTEGSETVTVTVAPAAGYVVGMASAATVTIADFPPPVVTVAATDATAAETAGGQSANPGQFTFTRTGNTSLPLTVTYTISDSATNGTDYQTLSGTITFAAGSATATLDVNVVDDGTVEPTEGVTVTLQPGTGYLVGSGGAAALVAIADNDVPPPAITGVAVIGSFLVVLGPTGQPSAIFPVAPGTQAFFFDVTGDGRGDAIISQPNGVILVLDGQTGRLALFVADLSGDRIPELYVIDTSGTVTRVI